MPLSTAFAKSCNTAFIASRDKASGDALPRAAASLGLTATPSAGVPAYLGGVPAPGSQVEAGAEMIGQGEITASPLGMATVVASVVKGGPVTPRIVIPTNETGATTPSASATPPTAKLSTLGSDAHEPQALGAGLAALEDLPGDVIAKTGTAEFGTTTPPKLHAWMVAARGDLAVAVFVDEGEGGSRTAGPILKAYLQG